MQNNQEDRSLLWLFASVLHGVWLTQSSCTSQHEEEDAFLLSLPCVSEPVIGRWNELLTIHLDSNTESVPKESLLLVLPEKLVAYLKLLTFQAHCQQTSWNKIGNTTLLKQFWGGGRVLKLGSWKGLKSDSVSETAQKVPLILCSKHPFCFDWAKSPRWKGKKQAATQKKPQLYLFFNHYADVFEFLLRMAVPAQTADTF